MSTLVGPSTFLPAEWRVDALQGSCEGGSAEPYCPVPETMGRGKDEGGNQTFIMENILGYNGTQPKVKHTCNSHQLILLDLVFSLYLF